LKNGEQEGKTGPVWGVGTSERRKDLRKGCMRVNVVEILCTWKNETVEIIPGMEDKGE
jgi:hypothetical protein